MLDTSGRTTELQARLARVRRGDQAALGELIEQTCGQLEKLTRKMLANYPGVRRWTQTDDVLQNALVRLCRALEQVQPQSMREFFALATTQIRRELLDLARHFYGPEGLGAQHASGDGPPQSQARPDEKQDLTHEPSALADWCEFHAQIDALPEEQREVVGLLFYQGLTQADTAVLLNVTVRTVQRRWQSALLHLHRIRKGQWPGE